MKQEQQIQEMIQKQIGAIRKKILILSGKGGVGKTTIAVNLALEISKAGRKTGLLDIDLHGPSVPFALNIKDEQLYTKDDRILPLKISENLTVMSIGFLLEKRESPVIWRGPRKSMMIRQLLSDVEWGPLDLLLIDCPPGTGDEVLSIVQTLEKPDGAIIVTTPQKLSLADVRKGINFCHELKVPVIGLIENMSGFICPHCGKKTDIFGSEGGRTLAQETAIPFLGSIPLSPAPCEKSEKYWTAEQTLADPGIRENFLKAIHPVMDFCE